MQRLSLSFFHDLGANLRPLKNLKPGPFAEVWVDLYSAQTALNTLLASQFMWGAMKSSWNLGQALSKVLGTTIENADFARDITPLEIFQITSAFSAYEPVLRAELSVADAVPEVLEAGKCLAFELCTAAGIHVLRALEIVLKVYFKTVTNGEPLPKNRNLGAYLKRLSELGAGDNKTIAVLTQIKDLHRNSLMHPEETLDKEAAINLFGMVISAISTMLKTIPAPDAPQIAATIAAPSVKRRRRRISS